MSHKRNYNEWTKEELITEVEALNKKKTYGLVWEEDKTKEVFDYYLNWDGEKTKEDFKDTKEKFPVLKEVKSKDIQTYKNQPFNLLIEGDNYHSLAVLNFTHNKQIDAIYIDPPYNTGNKDFKYNDQWVKKDDAYRHSKWLSFMEKRLKLCKNLLKNDGVIFISIDDHEVAQLRLLCDQIFGENTIGQFVRIGVKGGTRAQSMIATNHDYVLVYARNMKTIEVLGKLVDSLSLDLKDEKGSYRKGREINKWGAGSRRKDAPKMWFHVEGPNGEEVYPIRNDGSEGRWRWGRKKMLKAVENNDVIFEKRPDCTYIVYEKVRTEGKREIAHASLLNDTIYSNAYGTEELKNMFNGKSPFSYPKPMPLIKYLISMINKKEAIILDFFAGSGTTGHAISQLNSEDGGSRAYILCTNNEENICTDVCYPRIQKVIKGYTSLKGEKIEGLGGNLKYFRTDFVDAASTDSNKRKIVEKSAEMLCIKENAFEEVKSEAGFKIYKNNRIYLGIIFDEDTIDDFVKQVIKIDGKFHVYVFSLDETTPDYEFKGLKERVKLCPIPEVILHVYRRVFKDV